MLNGSADVVPKDGGSTRRKGDEEARRPLDSKPTRLCFGEPRLREMGVMLLVVGTDRDKAFRFMAETAGVLAGVVIKLKCCFVEFMGVPSKPLAFLEGDPRMLGSMFSVSKLSAKMSGE